jgi:hypothetical protein
VYDHDIIASAICAYSVEDIEYVYSTSAFYSSYAQNQRPIEPNERPSQCVSNTKSLSEEAVAFARTHPLLEQSIPNFFTTPLMVHAEARFGVIVKVFN